MSVIALTYADTEKKYSCNEMVKQSWLPGLICIPIFHCPRCLALYIQEEQAFGLCDAVDCSDHDQLIPFNITKCDLVKKIFNHQKATETRLCKQLSGTKPVKPELKPEKTTGNSFEKNGCQPIPVAEFVDIDKQLRKYRAKFMRMLKGINSEEKEACSLRTGRASSPFNDFKTQSNTQTHFTQGTENGVTHDYEDKAKETIVSVAECTEGRVQEEDLKCATEVLNKDHSVANQNSKFHPKCENARTQHYKSCFAKQTSGFKTRPSSSVEKSCLEKGLTIASKREATKPKEVTKTIKLIPPQTTKRFVSRSRRRLPSTEATSDVSCDKKRPEEQRQEAPELDKQSLKEVFGDKSEKLDANVVNSDWFQSLVEDYLEQGEKLETYRKELTRSFVFSYFEFSRN